MSCTHAPISSTALISSKLKTTPKTSRVSYVVDGVTRQKSITYANSRLQLRPARLPRPPSTLAFRMGTATTIRVLRKRLGVRNVTLAQCFVTHSLSFEYCTIFRRFALVLLKISIFLLSWNGCGRLHCNPPPPAASHGVSVGEFVSGTCGSRLSISISSEMTALFRFYFHFLFFNFPFFFSFGSIFIFAGGIRCVLFFLSIFVVFFSFLVSSLIKQIKNISIYTI